ncbi:MAG TPA: hypothetical protein VKA74_09880, partial [Myxococcota bacterium]|nr:hypothetical protein [Myxococcota bacterium]
SRTAGDALLEIQEACRDASERVDEIARATAEQSRNSKGVAESTQRTSLHIQQITEAMSEQRRASEEMLANAERALESCQHVHRSTEEQRAASRFITEAISGIRDMVRAIGEQTTVHSRASEDVSAAVMALLENAHQSGEILEPIRALIEALKSDAATVRGEEPAPSSGSGGDACGESSGGEGSQGPEIVRPYGPQRAPASGSLASPSSATASPAR